MSVAFDFHILHVVVDNDVFFICITFCHIHSFPYPGANAPIFVGSMLFSNVLTWPIADVQLSW